jgi:hypothetical protein
MLPAVELQALLVTTEEAVALAVSGHLVDGYDCLLAAPHFAEESSEARSLWAEELTRRYRDVLETYTMRYGVRF